MLREVVAAGGDASLCEARFVDGLTDEEVEGLFRRARESEYRELAREAERLLSSLTRKAAPAKRKAVAGELDKLHKRVAEISAIDFFGAPGRESVERLIFALDARLHEPEPKGKAMHAQFQTEEVRNRTWTTRKGIHVDRMSSAWLIRRFIDPGASFKFVPAKGYQPGPAELRFDMYDAEFTHEGDRCTFEVLLERFTLKDAALRSIAEIVHDIDLKDAKFARPETAGIDRLIAGVAMGHKDDDVRLTRAAALFDDLYEYFRRKQD